MWALPHPGAFLSAGYAAATSSGSGSATCLGSGRGSSSRAASERTYPVINITRILGSMVFFQADTARNRSWSLVVARQAIPIKRTVESVRNGLPMV